MLPQEQEPAGALSFGSLQPQPHSGPQVQAPAVAPQPHLQSVLHKQPQFSAHVHSLAASPQPQVH
ncbi:hypothetical protein ACTQ49_14215 [Luteococcus sp. Sow4_B9]|uniref:hypothetical protein n=1 Tax=Luteococcus sp. Sow4_B9 TaxID=3438792 RepID=UPI003F94AD88